MHTKKNIKLVIVAVVAYLVAALIASVVMAEEGQGFRKKSPGGTPTATSTSTGTKPAPSASTTTTVTRTGCPSGTIWCKNEKKCVPAEFDKEVCNGNPDGGVAHGPPPPPPPPSQAGDIILWVIALLALGLGVTGVILQIRFKRKTAEQLRRFGGISRALRQRLDALDGGAPPPQLPPPPPPDDPPAAA